MSDFSAFLPEEKRKLLSLLMKSEGIEVSARQTILSQERPAHLPLSFAQQRLYFLDQLMPKQAIYNNASAIRLLGPLDVPALERSFKQIVQRHESLRTTFVVNKEWEGQPEQVIAQELLLPLPIRDLCSFDASAREQEAHRLVDEEARTPFDLAQGPLIRCSLLKLDPQVHILLVTTHHIISDGLSLGILFSELSTLYAAYTTNQPLSLSELPVQYADFTLWQHGWLNGSKRQALRDYWHAQLQDAPPLLQLPTDHPRPPIQTYQGRSLELSFSAHLVEQLKRLSHQEDVTLFMTLLAAFQTLLYRYTGQSDVIVSFPIANRVLRETTHLIGFFANMLVLRTKLDGQSSFRELLRSVRTMTLDAYAHQDFPFEQLVEELAPVRNLSYNPLFQVAFVLQTHSLTYLRLPGIQTSAWLPETGTSKFDLTLILEETPLGLSGRIEYSTALFEEVSIKRMREHLQMLLESIVLDPACALIDLPLLSEQEQRQILLEWNATRGDFPRQVCIHELFTRQAAQTPDAIALEFQDRYLTYRQLDELSDSIAWRLQRLGIGLEARVGVYLDRSPTLLIALLGILKAGGAYVPLDLTSPAERIAFLLQDAEVSVLLTSEALRACLPALPLTAVCLDSESKDDGDLRPQMRPVVSVADENLAYIMYTSGSTGVPKGVGVTHRNVVHLVKKNTYAHLGKNEILLHLAPLAFDASTFEIWGALLNGGRLVLVPTQTPSLEEIGRIIQQHSVTTLWLTAGLFHQMVEAQFESLRGLKQLLAGGDVLAPGAFEKVLREAGTVLMTNGYGPTECTTFSSSFTAQGEAQISMLVPAVPIGRPIAHVQVYILDEKLRPVPVGVPGELYIAGAGLARGYLRLPALTAERFLPNPFDSEPGQRMYKTGDLVRYRNDGTIEFLGRIDRQVKFRGFRIEPGEIEAVLARYPGVRDVAVALRAEGHQEKHLLAYLVPLDPASPPRTSDLRAYAQQKLPSYMVPTAFVWLHALPLTPNRKLDAKALPLSEGGDSDGEDRYVAPRDALEAHLAEIWAEVFHMRQVSVEADFFALGGHSLVATRVLSRIYKKLRIELPMICLFESPTIAGLAQTIRQSYPTFSLPPGKTVAQHAETLLARIAEMSDEEVAALMNEIDDGEF